MQTEKSGLKWALVKIRSGRDLVPKGPSWAGPFGKRSLPSYHLQRGSGFRCQFHDLPWRTVDVQIGHEIIRIVLFQIPDARFAPGTIAPPA